MIDPEIHRRRRIQNTLQTAVLLGGSIGLLALCGWLIAGLQGVLIAAFAGALSLALSPRITPAVMLRLFSARPIRPHEAPRLIALMKELARRAGLPTVPALYYVPSAMMNAFALGRRDDPAIAVTDGMLRRLSLRELAGVLAHETTHIANNDLRVMMLADITSRLTRTMSFLGLLLIGMSLPAWLLGMGEPPVALGVLLLFAPTLGALLQLGLSRTREFDADLGAVELTGDPEGLATALLKLERFGRSLWETVLLPGRRDPEPSLLRTHPPTEERIRRIRSLAPREPWFHPEGTAAPTLSAAAARTPRWRASGLWY